jgi:flagellar biosynthesis protein FlhA
MRKFFGKQVDLILALSVVCILLVLFTPIPPGLLDLFLIMNFSFALLILLLTFHVDKPLDFSTFPSLLLIATLFRLSLNISATRLILSDANAGQVIDAVGTHVVAGNYIIGLIVFLVLIVVQYVVVTSGAQRVAEVAARFTLDSMPGKQMSIDADLNAGLIDDDEARSRRKQIEKEGNFYGAMDGASKFVKGDAIAGIIIVLIDIIGGLAIGIAQKGMEWGEALQTYTLLTVGDGIVTQIPALIISTGTGIIVTRASSDSYLSQEIGRQITAFPKTWLLIALGLLLVLMMPGMPTLPVLGVLAIVAVLAFYTYRVKRRKDMEHAVESETAESSDDVYGLLVVEPIEVSVGQNLIPLVGGDDNIFMDRIVAFRKQYAMDMGFVVPKVRFKDNKKLAPNAYVIKIYDAKVGQGEILQDHVLAINPGGVNDKLEGITTKDPTYGLPAVWIHPNKKDQAKSSGYTLVDPDTVLMTHLSEVFKQQSANLLTRAETEKLFHQVKERDPGLIEELIPNVLAITDVQKVLQNLLREKVSIRNMNTILEVLVDTGKTIKDPDHLTELVRQRLSPIICNPLMNNDGHLYVLTLDPSIEQSLATSAHRVGENAKNFFIEPKFAEQVLSRLMGHVEKMMSANHMPVLLCAPEIRRYLRQFTERVMPHLSVLSMSEVPNSVNLKSFGMVTV